MKKILFLTFWCLAMVSTSFAQTYNAGAGSGGDFGDTNGDMVSVAVTSIGADFAPLTIAGDPCGPSADDDIADVDVAVLVRISS